MPTARETIDPPSNDSRRALRAAFLTLFLDLIGFSIIFPLFPAMLEWYTRNDADSATLRFFLGLIHRAGWLGAGADQAVPIVLFGGLLGTAYSLLQFLAAPFWGRLSDRLGRRPILLVCIAGIGLSYVGWFFAASFLLLVLSRILGGLMAGNISVVTAAVADSTTGETRSKGMAMVGIAFGVGFILGPVLGGVASLLDLSSLWPEIPGLNPFSLPALLALVLSIVNMIYVAVAFRESLPPERRGRASTQRTINPLRVFQTFQFPGVGTTILAYFAYLVLFSGVEFTLTFLAAERLAYTPMDNGIMFLFIGVTLAVVQGGYVRRKAHAVGEKAMAIRGLLFVVPGLVLIGTAHGTPSLYAGLTFIAVGSAMATPCLTALVSLLTPATDQGRILGIFRSMGALSRAVGPIVACVLYWRLGAATAYILGAAGMLAPVAIALLIPKPSR
jgi:MFS family permease